MLTGLSGLSGLSGLVGSGSPPGFSSWYTQASSYGTITPKEQTAMLNLFAGLTAYNLRPSLRHLFLFGGDDSRFATHTARINKRSINLINPGSGNLTWSAINNSFALGKMDMYSAGQYGSTGINPSTYSGFSKADIGFSLGVTVAAPFANCAGGWNGCNIFLFTSSAACLDYWGNPPAGGATIPSGTGNITSVSTTTIGTGIKTYVDGSLLATGASGASIPDMSSCPFHCFWTPAVGGSPHFGRLSFGSDHKALSAGQAANLSTLIEAYKTAMNTPYYLNDTFTDTSGTSITAHTPEKGGGAWVESQSTWQIQSNAAKVTTSSPDHQSVAVIEAGVANCLVEASIKQIVANNDFGIVVNYQDNNNYWLVSHVTNTVIIYQRLAGTFYQRAAAIFAPPGNGNSELLSVAVNGDTISAYVNDNLVTSYTAVGRALKTATKHGIRDYSTPAATGEFLSFSVT